MNINLKLNSHLFVIATVFACSIIYADAVEPTWKAIYYHAMPAQVGVSADYCKAHEPGTFIGKVKRQLKQGATTNKGIILTNFTFHVEKKNGVYLMHGSVDATSQQETSKWIDHIQYYIYKLEQQGETNGVWTSGQCKGFFHGEVVKELLN